MSVYFSFMDEDGVTLVKGNRQNKKRKAEGSPLFYWPLGVNTASPSKTPARPKPSFFKNTIPVILSDVDPNSLRKTVGKASPILVALTSRSDSDVESSNVSLKENKPDGVNPNSNDIDYYVRKNEGKILWSSADC